MRISKIHKMPTNFSPEMGMAHESCMRSYQILERAKELLSLGTPAGVVLDLINEMEDTAT